MPFFCKTTKTFLLFLLCFSLPLRSMDGLFQSVYQKFFSANSEVQLSERVTGIATIAAVIAFCFLLKKVFNWNRVKTKIVDEKKRKKELNKKSEESESEGVGEENQQVAQLKEEQDKNTSLSEKIEKKEDLIDAYRSVTEYDPDPTKHHLFVQKGVVSHPDVEKKLISNNYSVSVLPCESNKNKDKGNRVLFLVCAPGTDIKDDTNQITRGIKMFAKKLAIAHSSHVDIFPLMSLGFQKLMKELGIGNVVKIWALASENGCSALNAIANKMRRKQHTIHYGVLMNFPSVNRRVNAIQENEKNLMLVTLKDAYNFKKLYHFYSPINESNKGNGKIKIRLSSKGPSKKNDMTLDNKLPVKIAYDRRNGSRRIWNICLKAAIDNDGKFDVKKVNREYVMPLALLGLSELITQIGSLYHTHYDLDGIIPVTNDADGIALSLLKSPTVTIANKNCRCLVYLNKKCQKHLNGKKNTNYSPLVKGLIKTYEHRSEQAKKIINVTYSFGDEHLNFEIPKNTAITWNEMPGT